jgi:glycerol-3-phosphate acyltransferase PlsY
MLVYVMCALSCIVAYLLCGIPSAFVVARAKGVDVRTVGSGNVGSTNVARSVGAAAGAVTLVCDVLKAVVSILLGYVLVGVVGTGAGLAEVVPGATFDWTMALVYLCCLLGHVFTPYLHFKGGKGIAVGLGGALALMPWVALGLVAVFAAGVALTRRVSVGSVAASVALPVLAGLIYRPSTAFLAVVCVTALLAVWAHRSNLVKLARGQEKPFAFKSKDEASSKAGE